MSNLPPTRERPMEDRLDSRKERRNRRKTDFLGALRFVCVLLLIGQCVRVAFTSPALRLRSVRVSGSTRLTSEEAIRLGAIPLGENIFRANLVRISERLRARPIFRSAVVTRDLPDGLEIGLEERIPAYQVAAGGRLHELDATGLVFQAAERRSPDLPLLEIPRSELPPPGQPLRPGLFSALEECVRLAALEHVHVRKMRVDGQGELWLNIAVSPTGQAAPGFLEVRVGRPTELPAKFRDIRLALIGWPDLSASAQYLNVMCAGRPAYLRLSDPGAAKQL